MRQVPEPDYRAVFDAAPAPLLLLSPDLVVVRANRAQLEATATTLEGTVGRHLADVFPDNPDDPGADGLARLRESLARVLRTRRPHTMDLQRYDIRLPDGTYAERVWSPRNVPVLDEEGEVVLLVHRADDITGYVRERAAAQRSVETSDRLRARAERVEADLFERTLELEQLVADLDRARTRAKLVADVTTALVATDDAEQVLTEVTRLVVPTLADWCVASLVVDDRGREAARTLRVVAAQHHDPALHPLVEEYAAVRQASLLVDPLLDGALADARPRVLAAAAQQHLASVLRPGRARELVGALAPESLVVLPLRGGDRTLGVLSLVSGTARSPISPEELATARDVAGRVGLALDNARLVRQQRELVETLQRSMLGAPARPPHLELVVRYAPAAEAAQVGGDWYDAFLRPDGTTVLTVGDVLGHDTEAAAAMGQVRSLLRGVAVATGGRPAEVLAGVDRAMCTLQVGTTATAVVAQLAAARDGEGRARLVWSNAGHPPPVLLLPDGSARPLVASEAELLLGVLPGTGRTDAEVDLPEGSALLLHTDGLVERRGESVQQGLDRLLRTLEDVAARTSDLDALCDGVLAAMTPDEPDDDVALLAVRLRPRERTPAAGRQP